MKDASDSLAEQIWVGRLTTDGDTLVFDGNWQPSMPGKVRLYSVERNEWRSFLPDKVRRSLQKVSEAILVRSAIDSYDAFERVERVREAQEAAVRAVGIEQARLESEAWFAAEPKRRRERTKALNRIHLSKLGVVAPTYRERADYLPERAPHCWACKQQLGSRQDLEHVQCGWLVCSCGACGCGRNAV